LGQRVLYFCSSLAMCILELKANSIPFQVIRQEYHYIDLDVNPDEHSIQEVPESFYIKDWVSKKPATQKSGDDWYASGRSLILKVRSAVLPTDANYLFNTTHADFSGLSFGKPFIIPLDPRVK